MKKRITKTTDPLDGTIDFTRFGPVSRNAFAGAVLLRRRRPGQGHRRTSTLRSVRLPEVLWAEMERSARAKVLNLHQAMRAALLGWIRRTG